MREQDAQHAGPAVELGEHGRQVVVAAIGVVHSADLHAGGPHAHGRRRVVEQTHSARLDGARVAGLHERRLAVAVIVVAEHPEDAERCRVRQAPKLSLQLDPAVRPAGEVAGDDYEVGPRRECHVDGLPRGAHVEAGPETDVEIGELNDGQAAQIGSVGRRLEAQIDAAHPLRLVHHVREAQEDGRVQRGRDPERVLRQMPQVTRPERRPERPRRRRPSAGASRWRVSSILRLSASD